MPRCRACFTLFNTDEGVLAHMQRSRDRRCRAKLNEYLLSAIRAHSSSPLLGVFELHEHEETPQESDGSQFEGDYFGDDYAHGDLPGLDGSPELEVALEVGGDDLEPASESEASEWEHEHEEEEEEAEEAEEEYLWCALNLLLYHLLLHGFP